MNKWSNLIKYRAYDKEANLMIYSDNRDRKDRKLYYFIADVNSNTYCMWKESYFDDAGYPSSEINKLDNIMQFSGFYDCKGNEIYDGDILHKDGYWDIRIEYTNGCFMVRNADNVQYINKITDCPMFQFDLCGYEIIGNIYENKELIK